MLCCTQHKHKGLKCVVVQVSQLFTVLTFCCQEQHSNQAPCPQPYTHRPVNTHIHVKLKLEKAALDGSVSTVASSALCLRRDGVTLNFDLLTQKRNQVICVPRCTSDKSSAKIYQQILEIEWKHENLGCIRSCRDLEL